MCASLLGRIARYGISPLRNSREDRLTGICAALFDSSQCGGLARDVALGWLKRATEQTEVPTPEALRTMRDLLGDPELSWSCDTRTQLRLDTDEGARRPDLELRFTGTDSEGVTTGVVLWIEVKHGTRPHSQQLRAYVDEQTEFPHSAVLLLAPRDQIPTFDRAEVPSQVLEVTWEETAELVKRFEPRDDAVIGGFLVGEFCMYLREEGLMDPDQLTPLHLVALANYREANLAMERLCDIADEAVRTRWNERGSHDSWPKQHPQVTWWGYPAHSRGSEPESSGPAWFCEWQLIRNGAEGRPGALCFRAGISADAATRPIAALSEAARRGMEQKRFELTPRRGGDPNEHVWRYAYPEEILAGADLVEQGHALANWIIDAFNVVSTVLEEARS